MELNFKEALAALARGFADFLVHAASFVACGFVLLFEFAALMLALRGAGIGAAAPPLLVALILAIGALTVAAWGRFLLRRRQAAMLAAFAGREPGEAGAGSGRRSPLARDERRLRRALFALRRAGEPAAARPGLFGLLAEAVFSRSILVLAASRSGSDPARALGEALALYWRQGVETRKMARRWLRFLLGAYAFLFAALAAANALVFRGAGAPAAIGFALAAVVAWALQRAFFAPLALAGVSRALIEEARGREPDEDLSGRIAPVFTP